MIFSYLLPLFSVFLALVKFALGWFFFLIKSCPMFAVFVDALIFFLNVT